MKARGRVSIVCGVLFLASAAHAQIVTDGSLGVRTSLSGPSYFIDPALGQQHGANLFHSFSTFNIGAGQRATFDGGQGVANIIARVTGSGASSIDGNVTANANLFLLNPQGILFGANASLNVAGSFHASTADYLRLSDGSRVYASINPASTFSVAPPAAFGFLDNSIGPLIAQGARLSVPSAHSFSLIGGHVTLADTQISVPNGQMNIAAVQSSGEVTIGANAMQATGFSSYGDIQLNQASINANTEGATTIFIRGNRFVMENQSAIFGLTTQAGTTRTIDIDVDSLQLRTSGIVSGATNNGAGTNTTIHARQFYVSDGSAILNTAAGVNAGGDIAISADDFRIDGSLSLVGTAAATGNGHAGDVAIQANAVSVNGGAISAVTGSAGGAGNIGLTADTVTLMGGGGVTSATTGAGNGGTVTITARQLNVDGTQGNFTTGISVGSTGGSGDAGVIKLNVDSLALRSGFISSSTAGLGRGGDVNITARNIAMDQNASITTETGVAANQNPQQGLGAGGAISINTQSMQVNSGSRVSANTFGNGSGGAIVIQANRLTVDQGSATSTTGITANTGSTTNNNAAGTGGNLNLRVDDLQMVNRGTISTNTYGAGVAGHIDILSNSIHLADAATISAASLGQNPNAGRANDVIIQSDTLTVRDRAQISNSTSGSGAAGRLLITTRALDIASGGLLQSSSLSTAANPGAAGDIFIHSDIVALHAASINARSFGVASPGGIVIDSRWVTLGNGSILSATSAGSGNAGNIVISASDSFELTGRSRIVTEALNGSGGNIRLFVANNLIIRESIVSTSVLGSASNGGNIGIDPIISIVDNSQIIARAVGGSGGRIDFSTRYLLQSADSTIDASSALGINGSVEIGGIDVDLDADIAQLPTDFLNAKQWLATSCAARQGNDISQFTVDGRDGAYHAPLDFGVSPMQFDELPSAGSNRPSIEHGATAALLPHLAAPSRLAFVPLCIQRGG